MVFFGRAMDWQISGTVGRTLFDGLMREGTTAVHFNFSILQVFPGVLSETVPSAARSMKPKKLLRLLMAALFSLHEHHRRLVLDDAVMLPKGDLVIGHRHARLTAHEAQPPPPRAAREPQRRGVASALKRSQPPPLVGGEPAREDRDAARGQQRAGGQGRDAAERALHAPAPSCLPRVRPRARVAPRGVVAVAAVLAHAAGIAEAAGAKLGQDVDGDVVVVGRGRCPVCGGGIERCPSLVSSPREPRPVPGPALRATV